MRALIWFTRDLRTRDNQIFEWLKFQSKDHPCEVMAVAFEPVQVSAFQLRFFHETVADLKVKLSQQGVSLDLIRGRPDREISKIVKLNQIDQVLVTKPFNSREEKILDKVIQSNSAIQFQIFDQRTLMRLEDLPFSLDEMPLVFTSFRKQIEKSLTIPRARITETEGLKGFSPVFPESSVAVDLERSREMSVELPYSFLGGEDAAWSRVQEYFWETESLSHYKETRNGMIEKNDSSKFSPWLANGSLSARSLFEEIKNYEAAKGANDSTYWLFFELLWRDYFKFLSLKIGERLFSRKGLSDRDYTWGQDHEIFQAWCRGETGLDFVDANMTELLLTGWMSNRGRQNVASHLAKGLEIDWTWGAQYFESQLLDSDPESNWGNWLYVAGVGTDPRDRLFNISRQAEMYDPDAVYRKKWLEKRLSPSHEGRGR